MDDDDDDDDDGYLRTSVWITLLIPPTDLMARNELIWLKGN